MSRKRLAIGGAVVVAALAGLLIAYLLVTAEPNPKDVDVSADEIDALETASCPPQYDVLRAKVERANIEIQVGSAIRIPVTLEIGQMTDTVQVVADTPVIQTENASIEFSKTC